MFKQTLQTMFIETNVIKQYAHLQHGVCKHRQTYVIPGEGWATHLSHMWVVARVLPSFLRLRLQAQIVRLLPNDRSLAALAAAAHMDTRRSSLQIVGKEGGGAVFENTAVHVGWWRTEVMRPVSARPHLLSAIITGALAVGVGGALARDKTGGLNVTRVASVAGTRHHGGLRGDECGWAIDTYQKLNIVEYSPP